jgi:hypothetical protein
LRAVRRPRSVEGTEDAVAPEHPVADLLIDEDLLFAIKVVHGLPPADGGSVTQPNFGTMARHGRPHVG